MRFVPKYIYAKYYYGGSILTKLEIKDIIISFMMSDRSYWDTNMNETIDKALAIYEKEPQSTGTAVVRSLAKNDPEAVRQFLGILYEWARFYPTYEMSLADIADPPPIGGETFIDNLSEARDNVLDSGIDCASIVMAALNGLLPIDVFYNSSTLDINDAIELASKYPWAENLLRWQNESNDEDIDIPELDVGETRDAPISVSNIKRVRQPYQIAALMYQRGQMVMEWNPEDMNAYDGETSMTDALAEQGLSPEDIQPGDIVFFAEKNNGEYIEQDGFKHISHMAVVVEGGLVAEAEIRAQTSFRWYHRAMQVISPFEASYYGEEEATFAKGEKFTPQDSAVTNYRCEPFKAESLWVEQEEGECEFSSGKTMVLVCRPNLKVTSEHDNLRYEAERLGLHTVPRDRNTLNIIKRARQFADVKWTPSVDIDRYSAKYYDNDEDDFVYYDTQFSAGTEYTGVPLFAYPHEERQSRTAVELHHVGIDCGLDAFVTATEAQNESTLLYACTPEDFVSYVYETSVNNDGSNYGFELNEEGYADTLLGSMVTLDGGGIAVVTDLILPGDEDMWGYSYSEGDALVEVCVASQYAGIGPVAISDSAANGTIGGTVRRVTMTIDELYGTIMEEEG